MRSMTGFGSARVETDAVLVRAEVKSVNGRFLKVSMRLPPALQSRESAIEALVRTRVERGSLSIAVFAEPKDPARLVAVNEAVVRAYQLEFRRLGLSEERIPTLPGVLGTPDDTLAGAEWSAVEAALHEALDRLVSMREREGAELHTACAALLDDIDAQRESIGERAPQVVLDMHEKLRKRLDKLLEGRTTAIEPETLAREIALYADRTDITEELERLRAHVVQCRELLREGRVVGRSLDFLSQEMHREANTIGSKASDAAIAHRVVELKAAIERIKEQVANVE